MEEDKDDAETLTDQVPKLYFTHPAKEKSKVKRFCTEKIFTARTRNEIKQLVYLALPAMFSNVLYVAIGTVCVLFAGHLGKLELAAMSLGLSVVNICGVAVGFGLATALETFCSQAYGAKNFRLVGIVLQRGILIFGLSLFPIFALWINIEKVLIKLHQTREVARLCQNFMDIFLLALPFEFIFILLTKYLQSQEIMKPVFYIGFLGNAFHIGMQLVGRYVFRAGFRFVVWSAATAYILLAVLLWAYIVWRKLHKKTWEGWSFDSLTEWGSFMKLAIPGLFMVCLEFWGFEIGAFLMGSLDELQLGVHGMLSQVAFMLFMIPLGLSVATCVRVGNMLGRGDAKAAKHVVKVSLSCTTFTAFTTAVTVYFSRNVIGYVFTSERKILNLFRSVVRTLALAHIFDSYQGVCAGIVLGCGRQLIGVTINFVSYYVIGLPVSGCLAFYVDAVWGVQGLWWGLTLGLFVQSSLHFILQLRTNWDEQVRKAKRRTGAVDLSLSNSHIMEDIEQKENSDAMRPIAECTGGGFKKTFSVASINNLLSNISGRVGYKLANYKCPQRPEQDNPLCVCDRSMTRASHLSPAEKKALIVKRLIPFLFGFLLVIISAVFRFTTPLLDDSAVAFNSTLTGNTSVFNATPSYSFHFRDRTI